MERFGRDSEKVRDWMGVNKSKRNPGKMRVLLVGPHLALGNGGDTLHGLPLKDLSAQLRHVLWTSLATV